MKKQLHRMLCLVCVFCLMLAPSALADDVAVTLMAQEGCQYYLAQNQIDVIIRPSMTPFFGSTENSDYTLCAFIDYVQLA